METSEREEEHEQGDECEEGLKGDDDIDNNSIEDVSLQVVLKSCIKVSGSFARDFNPCDDALYEKDCNIGKQIEDMFHL